ncbi:MAG: histidine kinase [Krumholzibacteria bacterium]|nr:histidine kinase [Candidatus Krumholzibacteria bacterium]
MHTLNRSGTREPQPDLAVPWRVWLLAWTCGGLLLFTYHHLAVLAAGGKGSPLPPLINEMTSALGSGLGFFAVRLLVRRWRLDRGYLLRRLPAYLIGIACYSTVQTSWRWAARAVLYPAAGLGDYDYGRMPLRFLMELPADAIVFMIMAAALHAWRHVAAARARELHTLRLQRSLADANLRNLQLQLQPHFLFNALNTVSATMYRDVAQADTMISRLADLLRASLRTARSDCVPLAEELVTLDDYLAIMRARFEERLQVTVTVQPGLDRALVPPFLLQPLVENAIGHGGVEVRGTGRVQVVVGRDERPSTLSIVIEDDGPGLAQATAPLRGGVGLGATAERLRLLYGDAHTLAIDRGALGGCRVTIRLPLAEGAP